MFGIVSIPLFISFLLISDPKTLGPILRPIFAKSDPSPFPDCLAASFRFFLIFLNASLARLKYIQWLFLLGPIVLTLMFMGSHSFE